ncbi:4'-phosphopantetheinyl transferase superfamily protein [Chromobacterium sp. IIBBL 290-4]|uniref:4'-phosphopantetheinyl transferase family protein n=1 Tax=Chromobacterium sp. IIBBL 290-4 TaxID=2953890 RepID=UPI0020B741A8|nr:4'-phosphopantetheinyl transferase superfamily protein [Chromobacterium sp. IIBBL 290-4]UTH76448.1 4'-phosphopantetheinyl transferase superfamily protein [Chromobacterium sp. IIBBL 290-4]
MNAALALPENHIHLWLCLDASINDPDCLECCERMLDKPEQARRWRFHFPKHRHQFLLTRALVRCVLSCYTDVRPEEWTFIQDAYGKPAIAGPEQDQPLHFNVSHTDGLIVVAVARQGTVGVDVENLRREGSTFELANSFFAVPEREWLRALPSADKPRRFFELWTLKEAYVKARGQGLSIALDSFHFRLDADGGDILFDAADSDPCRWHFWSWSLFGDYRLALAAMSDKANVFQVEVAGAVPALAGDAAGRALGGVLPATSFPIFSPSDMALLGASRLRAYQE